MLTESQTRFLRNKGVNVTLKELLESVRQRRTRRERFSELITKRRNFLTAQKRFKNLSNKDDKLETLISNQYRRLARNHQPLVQNVIGWSRVRNRIRNLPKTVPRNVDMREFVRLLNNRNALIPDLTEAEKDYRTAAIKFIQLARPNNRLNNTRLSLTQLTTYANSIIRNLDYEKGKTVGKIIGTRATNPGTVIGRRTIEKMFTRN